MHQEFTELSALIDYALTTPDRLGKGVYVVGTVGLELAQLIDRAIGLPTLGLRITIDHSSILHVLRKHGQEKTEFLRGQRSITVGDLEELAQWLARPDDVEDAGQKPHEPRCLRFLRAQQGELLTVVLSVRTGRHKQQLSLKTMYKKRLAT